MRKFLVEYVKEITMDDVRESWEQFAEDGETFAQYLNACLDKNGALTEILTADTPRENRRGAVTLCRVIYGDDDPDDYCEEWLTEQERSFKEFCGCTVICGW